jgi:hypothetical protein
LEPLVAAPDEQLALRDPRILDAALPPQSNGNRMLFWIGLVAFCMSWGLMATVFPGLRGR